jgi:hypothetical protein
MTKKQYNNTYKIFLQKHFDLTEFVPKAIFHTMNMRSKQMHEQSKIQPYPGYYFMSVIDGQ